MTWATGDEPLQTVRGAGRMRVASVRLYSLPVFEPLADFLNRLLPGLNVGGNRTDADAEWQASDGRLRLDPITVNGDVLSLIGRGAYAFTNSLDFDIQVKLMKDSTFLGRTVRILTFPVSKLFEFRLRGTTDNPRWYPVNFSSDVLEKILYRPRQAREGSER